MSAGMRVVSTTLLVLSVSFPLAAAENVPPDLSKVNPARLVPLALKLKKAGPEGRGDRAALAQRIAGKYLADAASVRRLTPRQWNNLYSSLRDVADIDDWATAIWSAYGVTSGAEQLTVFDPGISGQALAAILPHMPLDKVAVFSAQADKAGFGAEEAADILQDRLLAAAGDERLVASLSADALRVVANRLVEISPKAAAQATLTWVRRGGDLSNIRPNLLGGFVKALEGCTQEERDEVVERLDVVFAGRSLSWDDCARISESWSAMKSQGSARQWAMRAYESALGSPEARAAADAKTLLVVGEAVEHARLFGEEGDWKAYPEFAEVLVRLLREGKYGITAESTIVIPALLIGGDAETLAMVEAELIDASGGPRMEVAKILSWANYYFNRVTTWMTLLEERIASAPKGPGRAQWMLAQVHAWHIARFAMGEPMDPNWLSGFFQTTGDAAMRLEAAKTIVLAHYRRWMPEEGEAFLAEAHRLFGDRPGEAVAAGLAKLEDQADQARQDWLRWRIGLYRHQISEAQERADEAEQDGNTASRDFHRRFANQYTEESASLERQLK